MKQCQETNRNNLEMAFQFSIMLCWVYLLKSHRWGGSKEYTQHKNLNKLRECTLYIPKYLFSWVIGRIYKGLKIEFESTMVIKRAIGVQKKSKRKKTQPFPDTTRKRKPTKPNQHKSNKRTKSTKISSLFPKWGNRNAKRTEKQKNKITQGKT